MLVPENIGASVATTISTQVSFFFLVVPDSLTLALLSVPQELRPIKRVESRFEMNRTRREVGTFDESEYSNYSASLLLYSRFKVSLLDLQIMRCAVLLFYVLGEKPICTQNNTASFHCTRIL